MKHFRAKLVFMLVFLMVLQTIVGINLTSTAKAAESYRYDNITGKYYINVPLTGSDFNNTNSASDNIYLKTDTNLFPDSSTTWVDDTTAPLNKWIITSGATGDGNQIIPVAKAVYDSAYSYDGTACLQFGNGQSTSVAVNLIYKVNGLETNATYRLSAMMKAGNTGAFTFGVKNYDASNYTTGSSKMLTTTDMNLSTTEWKEVSLLFTPTQATNPHAKIAFWAGATAKPIVYVDGLKLEKVSDTPPITVTDPGVTDSQLVNGGNFEDGGGEVTVDTSVYNKFISTNNNYSVVNNEKYSGNYSLRIGSTNASETITYMKNDLLPSTKYRINFYAKVGTAGNLLQFRLSGYNTDKPFKIGDILDQGNLMNYVEHTKIKNTTWASFHYDFETGANVKNAYIEFNTPAGSIAYLDDIDIVKVGVADPALTTPQISRGNSLFMQKGLQIEAWTPTDVAMASKSWMKYPSVEDILDLGLTTIQYNDAPNYNKNLHDQYRAYQIAHPELNLGDLKWGTADFPNGAHLSSLYTDQNAVNSNDAGKNGAPTEAQKQNGFLSNDQLADLANLNNLCFGDEEDYSDTLTQTLKDWYDVSKEKYPNVLVHHNEVGNTPPSDIMSNISTFNENMLRKYVHTAKPDFISYDMYYWRESRQSQEVGGTVIPFYDDLNRYRKIASEGYDGTGNSPIPFGHYMQAWRTGPGAATPEKRGDGWYEMTESQINLDAFAGWTFGAKWLSSFRWIDDSFSYLFTDSRVDENGNYQKYYIYDIFKEMIRQSKNLGDHLVRLNNKDVVIVPGYHMDASGLVVKNTAPASNKEWSKSTDQAFIDNVEVKNLGVTNNNLNGDVFISYSEPIPGLDTTQFFTSTAPKYFMILNGLTSGDGLPASEQEGSSYETRQQIKVTFDLSNGIDASKLKKVSRLTGEIVDVPIENIGDGKYQMTTEVGGGMADLYFWELGNINTTNVKNVKGEDSKDPKLTGDIKYAKNREKRDLKGRTVTIGWIKDTYNPVPKPFTTSFGLTKNANGSYFPLTNANKINYFTRDFEQDIWNVRVDRIQKENNVTIKLVPDIDWSKDDTINNVARVKEGETVTDMPDILIVPDEWLWTGMIKSQSVIPASRFSEFDLNQRKWNKMYQEMSTLDNDVYSLYAGPTLQSTGTFVNRKILPAIGVTDDLAALQRSGTTWDWTKLKEIADKLKASPNGQGKYLFADTDELFRQMVYSNNATFGDVSTKQAHDFDINTQSFADAAKLYSDLYSAGLIAEKPDDASDDWYVDQFSQGNILFLVAPYDGTSQKLRTAYTYQDVTVNMIDGTFLGKPAKVPDITSVTDVQVPAGEYTISADSWVYLMFPKGPAADGYSAIIDKPAYPVIMASAQNPSDVAFIWNQLSEEYTGVEYTRFLRTFMNQRRNSTDLSYSDNDTLKRIGLKEGVADFGAETNAWQEVIKPNLMPVLKTGNLDADIMADLSEKVKDFVEGNLTDETSIPDTGSGNSDDNSNDGSNYDTSSSAVLPAEKDINVEITVDGRTSGQTATTMSGINDGRHTINVKLDQKAVEGYLMRSNNGAKLSVKVNQEADDLIVELNGQTLKHMEEKQGVIEFKSPEAAYTVMARQVDINNIAAAIGKDTDLKDIGIRITISKPAEDVSKLAAKSAENNGLVLLGSPVSFKVEYTFEGRGIQVDKFKSYVERTMLIPDGADTNKNIMGVVIEADGTIRPVPTQIMVESGKCYAKIKSLTNSVYAVVSSNKSFTDIKEHWAEEYINELASRLIINGVDKENFAPDTEITRAEFTAIIVRALGLKHDDGDNEFSDVHKNSWYHDAVSTAYQYSLINGYNNGTFRPESQVTREEAMTILVRAMKLAGKDTEISVTDIQKEISRFEDESKLSSWASQYAAICIRDGIIKGSNGAITPDSNITRAETAALILRMLKQADLA